MAVEEGDRYRSVSNFQKIWIVRRFITGPRMVPHAVLTQVDDASSIRTVSFRTLEDKHLFELLSADAVKS
jgi:hypothetical protein